MLVPGWELLGFGFEECRASRGARKVVEVLPASEVDEMRGKVEFEEEVARPVAVPYPPSLILGDLELVLETLEVSRGMSSVPMSSRSRSLSRAGPDLGGMRG